MHHGDMKRAREDGCTHFNHHFAGRRKLLQLAATALDKSAAPAAASCRSLCVQCGALSPHAAREHRPPCGHTLLLDTAQLELFCHACGDHVYSAQFDDALRDVRVNRLLHRNAFPVSTPSNDPGAAISARRQALPPLPQRSGAGGGGRAGGGARGGLGAAGEEGAQCQPGWRRVRVPDGLPLGLRGLNNLGHTCFMNSVLQVLLHAPLLRAYFLGEGHCISSCRATERDKPCLSCQLDAMFAEVYSGERNPFSPSDFLYQWWQHADSLAGYQQQDAHEFFLSLLEGLGGCRLVPGSSVGGGGDCQRAGAPAANGSSGAKAATATGNARAAGPGSCAASPLAAGSLAAAAGDGARQHGAADTAGHQLQPRQHQAEGAEQVNCSRLLSNGDSPALAWGRQLGGSAGGGASARGLAGRPAGEEGAGWGAAGGRAGTPDTLGSTPEPEERFDAPAHESLVESCFSGLLRSDVTCCTCGRTSTAFDPFRDISLDLPAALHRRHAGQHGGAGRGTPRNGGGGVAGGGGGGGATPSATPLATPMATPLATPSRTPPPSDIPDLSLGPSAATTGAAAAPYADSPHAGGAGTGTGTGGSSDDLLGSQGGASSMSNAAKVGETAVAAAARPLPRPRSGGALSAVLAAAAGGDDSEGEASGTCATVTSSRSAAHGAGAASPTPSEPAAACDAPIAASPALGSGGSGSAGWALPLQLLAPEGEGAGGGAGGCAAGATSRLQGSGTCSVAGQDGADDAMSPRQAAPHTRQWPPAARPQVAQQQQQQQLQGLGLEPGHQQQQHSLKCQQQEQRPEQQHVAPRVSSLEQQQQQRQQVQPPQPPQQPASSATDRDGAPLAGPLQDAAPPTAAAAPPVLTSPVQQSPMTAAGGRKATQRVARCGLCHYCKNRHLKKGCLRNKQQLAKEVLAPFADVLELANGGPLQQQQQVEQAASGAPAAAGAVQGLDAPVQPVQADGGCGDGLHARPPPSPADAAQAAAADTCVGGAADGSGAPAGSAAGGQNPRKPVLEGVLSDAAAAVERAGGAAAAGDATIGVGAGVSSPALAPSTAARRPQASQLPPPAPATTLLGCLRRFVRPERLAGAGTAWRCSGCGSSEAATKQLSLRQLPPLLCLHLKRFEHTGGGGAHRARKLDAQISFPVDTLDMTPFLSSSLLRQRAGLRPPAASSPAGLPAATGTQRAPVDQPLPAPTHPPGAADARYVLFGVVSHRGDMAGGHYVSYVRCGVQWYRCDDAWVTRAAPDEVANCQAYLLFYAQRAFYAARMQPCPPTGAA